MYLCCSAPDYFNEVWLGKVKTEDVTNWRLKVSNLKKILKGILEYNLEVNDRIILPLVLCMILPLTTMPILNAISAEKLHNREFKPRKNHGGGVHNAVIDSLGSANEHY